jgi:hypothetical protein
MCLLGSHHRCMVSKERQAVAHCRFGWELFSRGQRACDPQARMPRSHIGVDSCGLNRGIIGERMCTRQVAAGLNVRVLQLAPPMSARTSLVAQVASASSTAQYQCCQERINTWNTYADMQMHDPAAHITPAPIKADGRHRPAGAMMPRNCAAHTMSCAGHGRALCITCRKGLQLL